MTPEELVEKMVDTFKRNGSKDIIMQELPSGKLRFTVYPEETAELLLRVVLQSIKDGDVIDWYLMDLKPDFEKFLEEKRLDKRVAN